MKFESTFKLQRENISLVLLNQEYAKQLMQLAINEKIWEFAPDSFYKPDIFKNKWLDKAFTQMNQNERACFIVLCGEQVIGTSSYYNIDVDKKTLNIGYTWFHPDYWGSKINAISKIMLLDYVFDSLKFSRVGFCVDSINQRSCNALKKLGIRQEEILKNHLLLSNGRVRHSAVFSVIFEEWPEIRKIIMKHIEVACK